MLLAKNWHANNGYESQYFFTHWLEEISHKSPKLKPVEYLLSINRGSKLIESECCVNTTWIGFASKSPFFNQNNDSYSEFSLSSWHVNKVLGSENPPLDCGLLQHKSFEHWLCTINRTCIFTACLVRWHIELIVILKSEPKFPT